MLGRRPFRQTGAVGTEAILDQGIQGFHECAALLQQTGKAAGGGGAVAEGIALIRLRVAESLCLRCQMRCHIAIVAEFGDGCCQIEFCDG